MCGSKCPDRNGRNHQPLVCDMLTRFHSDWVTRSYYTDGPHQSEVEHLEQTEETMLREMKG